MLLYTSYWISEFHWDFWLATTPKQLNQAFLWSFLRSLLPPRLMNGTRCLVLSCGRNVIEVEVAVDLYAGERHVIPRITLQPSESTLPFQFQRKQFPLQPCFAMTINTSQGQSLKTVGLHLHQPVFSHGMLYVALSRTGNNKSIYVFTSNGNSRKCCLQGNSVMWVSFFFVCVCIPF